jgi:hypothetical protein
VYQSSDPRDKGNYRTLKVSKTIEVSSSLRVNAFTRASLCNLNEFILGVEVTNIRSSFDIIFRQISAISPFWRVSLVDEADEITCRISPNETKILFLKLTRQIAKNLVLHTFPEFITTFAIERLVLAQDQQKLSIPDCSLFFTSLASTFQLSDCSSLPLQALLSKSKNSSKLEALHQQYPTFSLKQLIELFTKYWSDDLDLLFFFEGPDSTMQGHIAITGLNLSLEPPLPLASWLSGLDSKTLAGRALFERTFQERKELINSLLKSKMSDSSPVRVILHFEPEHALNNGYSLESK